MAPAITLNRMYHCVPISSSTMAAIPMPPPQRISTSSTMGNSAVAGTDAATCASGCTTAEIRGFSPTHTPTGMAHSPARTSVSSTRRKVLPAPARMVRRSEGERFANSLPHANHGIQQAQQRGDSDGRREPAPHSARGRSAGPQGAAPRQAEREGFRDRIDGGRRQARQRPRAPQHLQDRRSRRVRRFHLLELELLAPGDHRTPDRLVHHHDHRDHGPHAPQDRPRIARIGRGLQVRAQAGKPQVAVVEHEHLARHQEEPASRHRHHGVPHQADGAVWQFELHQALPPGKPVDLARLQHLARNALHGGVHAEGHVPDLPGEDQQDRAHLHAQLAGGKQRRHGHHHARQKAEHGDGLQRVEQRDHHPLGLAVDAPPPRRTPASPAG